MKFHVPVLCLATILTAGSAWADHTTTRVTTHDYYVYAGEPLYYRQVFYPNLPSEEYVADKLSRIIDKQRIEIAHLASFADRADTAGFNNIESVYEHMAGDHGRIVEHAANWLAVREFPVPPTTTTVAIANLSPHDSIHHMLDMHVRSFNDSLSMMRSEPSSTVRTTLLWAAATTSRHISLLRLLDRDVEFGRKELTALLRSSMDSTFMASNQTELMNLIMAEEITTLKIDILATAQPQYVQVDREVEVPVERRVEVQVERRVEVPVERVVERVVEKPVYINRVAGQRQVRARRPAK